LFFLSLCDAYEPFRSGIRQPDAIRHTGSRGLSHHTASNLPSVQKRPERSSVSPRSPIWPQLFPPQYAHTLKNSPKNLSSPPFGPHAAHQSPSHAERARRCCVSFVPCNCPRNHATRRHPPLMAHALPQPTHHP
jgi:hypothetical protein